MQDGALHDGLESRGLDGLRVAGDGEALCEELLQVAREILDISAAREDDLLAPVEKKGRKEHVLGCEVFVTARFSLVIRGDDDLVQVRRYIHLCLFAARPQGKLALASHLVHLRHLCRGDVVCVHAHDTSALLVHVEHDLRRLGRRLVEHRDDDLHDEVHRRVVVVVQDDPEELWLLETGFLLDAGVFLEDPGGFIRHAWVVLLSQ